MELVFLAGQAPSSDYQGCPSPTLDHIIGPYGVVQGPQENKDTLIRTFHTAWEQGRKASFNSLTLSHTHTRKK